MCLHTRSFPLLFAQVLITVISATCGRFAFEVWLEGVGCEWFGGGGGQGVQECAKEVVVGSGGRKFWRDTTRCKMHLCVCVCL